MHKGDDPSSITSCFSSGFGEKHYELNVHFSKNPGEKHDGISESDDGGDSGGNTSG